VTADKVIDASALAALIFFESQAEEAGLLLASGKLFAPSLLFFELAHVCVKKIERRPAEADVISRQFQDALTIPIEIVDVKHAECVAVARTFKLSAYDASYLWLSHKLDCDLVTFDKGLRKALAKSNI
jgi:predicted nucleic acid-binding protein